MVDRVDDFNQNERDFPQKGKKMDLIYTHTDRRNYRHSSKGDIQIKSEPSYGERIQLSFTNEGKKILSLRITPKEGSAIVGAINSALSGCECVMQIKED
jgi:hypothetical protein